MTDSHIHLSQGGTTFVGEDAVRLFQAATVRSGIKLLLLGITPSRGWTMKKALVMASLFTGRVYLRSEAQAAISDLQIWIETMKAALPVVEDR